MCINCRSVSGRNDTWRQEINWNWLLGASSFRNSFLSIQEKYENWLYGVLEIISSLRHDHYANWLCPARSFKKSLFLKTRETWTLYKSFKVWLSNMEWIWHTETYYSDILQAPQVHYFSKSQQLQGFEHLIKRPIGKGNLYVGST